MLTKLKQLDRKQKIGLVIAAIAIFSFGFMNYFFDGEHGERNGNFKNGKQIER